MLTRLDENIYQICDKAYAGNTRNNMCYYDLTINYILRKGYTRDVFEPKFYLKLCLAAGFEPATPRNKRALYQLSYRSLSDFIRSKLFEHLLDHRKTSCFFLRNHQGSSITKTLQGRFLLRHRSQNPVTH